jgi:hypothetical protein
VREIAAVLSLALLLDSAIPARGQAADPAPGDRPAPPPRSAEVWGEAYYQVAALDSASSPSSLGVQQEAGLSLNVRGPRGLEVLADFVVPLDADLAMSPDALLSQLFVRASPVSGVSLSAGRQRLTWGTARVFSPIVRSCPESRGSRSTSFRTIASGSALLRCPPLMSGGREAPPGWS